jgi:molybdate transport system regulatory protein
MRMSYRRAWLLAKTMNACFREPLIEAAKGGTGGGGARLTALGREVLALYRAMEDHAARAVMSDMEKLRALMVAHPPED